MTSLSSTINSVKMKESSMAAATANLTTNKRNVYAARHREISKPNHATNKSIAVTRLQTTSTAKAKTAGLQGTSQSKRPRFIAKRSSIKCKTRSRVHSCLKKANPRPSQHRFEQQSNSRIAELAFQKRTRRKARQNGFFCLRKPILKMQELLKQQKPESLQLEQRQQVGLVIRQQNHRQYLKQG